MKKLNVVIIVVILIFCSNFVFAATTINSNLETNQEIKDLITISSPLKVISIPFGFFGTFIQGFVLVIAFSFVTTLVCKLLINSNRSFKTYLTHKRLGKIMDRMYYYKRDV